MVLHVCKNWLGLACRIQRSEPSNESEELSTRKASISKEEGDSESRLDHQLSGRRRHHREICEIQTRDIICMNDWTV